MTKPNFQSGFAEVNGAKLYYELAGEGQPFLMIHAGVADSRQWNGEFDYFARHYRVLRFDMRGYGKSEPVTGVFNIQDDFVTLLNTLNITEPMILMGCSIGAGLTVDFALEFPQRTQAIILVGGAPRGLELDVEEPALFADAQAAYEAKNLDLVAEIETRIWFDGQNRTSDQTNPDMRKLAYEMNRLALEHEAKELGEHVRKEGKPAVERLDELTLPTLVIVGQNDIPFILAAADYMEAHLPLVKKVVIPNAAHLPNMDQPQAFQGAIDLFLTEQQKP